MNLENVKVQTFQTLSEVSEVKGKGEKERYPSKCRVAENIKET